MSDLFSALDCNTIKISFLLWFSPFIVLLALVHGTFSSAQSVLLNKSLKGAHMDSRKDFEGWSLLLFSLILMIASLNLVGLMPYTYGNTSSLWVAGSLALILWGCLVISGWSKSVASSVAHLTPSGAPVAVAPLLVLIETISVLIRPLTLTVRLIANISAGHIVLSLVANCLTAMTSLSMLLLNTGYSMFEVFVCMIQAYIFSLLIKLYGSEHP
uniref:ATP synthase subunit a n=1 Tax=Bulla sp. TLT-2006 TaxID=407128 RepID=E6Y152_9GAST|nr:ATP synthase F0 subunit 6 [Bulla sp. TLT-2006]